MKLIKLAGCIVALVVLIAFIAPVSAAPFYGYSQTGSKYSGNQVSLNISPGIGNDRHFWQPEPGIFIRR